MADPNLVATNAHVVAGVDNPAVIDANGVHPAAVVTFDPDLEFAVLRTSGLAGNPLPLDHSVAPRGTVAAALGYPGGQESLPHLLLLCKARQRSGATFTTLAWSNDRCTQSKLIFIREIPVVH